MHGAQPEGVLDIFHPKLHRVARFPDRSVKLFHVNNAAMSHASNAILFRGSSVTLFHYRYPDRNAAMFHASNALLFHGNNATTFQESSAVMSLVKFVKMFPDNSIWHDIDMRAFKWLLFNVH